MNVVSADTLREEVADERARRRLHAFLTRYWSTVEPSAPFKDNWHVHAICEHLEAVTSRQIKRLVINVPFRTAKSTITSVMWPAWTWARAPEHQWLCGSYAEKLALRDSLKMRRLVTGPLYQRAYGDQVQIAADQNQKVRWQNTRNGHRIAFGMLGGVMGDGGDTLLIDDPHDRNSAHSDAERGTALTTYDQALVTRLNNPATGAIVIIMQRLHEKDLSGHALEEGGWVHLMIPMEFEAARRCVTVLGWRDPRQKEGELMHPERFPAATVAQLKLTLGTYGTAGQLQQRPAPEGGGVLKTECFKLWPAAVPMPDFSYVVQSYDTAFTEETKNDQCACSVWGVFRKADGRVGVMLLEFWAEHIDWPALRPRVVRDWGASYGGDRKRLDRPARRADALLIEDKGSGIALIRELRTNTNIPVLKYNPGNASKLARAHIAAPYLEAGVFYVPESRRTPGAWITWAAPLKAQLSAFPNGEFDDGVDTFTQAAILLRDTGHLEDVLESAPDREEEDRDYRAARAPANPYAQ